MKKFLRKYVTAVLSLVIIVGLAAVSFADQNAAKNEARQASEKSEEAKQKAKQKQESEQGDSSSAPNHGQCVSYAARLAKELDGSARGAFISAVAKDEDAVSEKVAKGEDTQSASCLSAIGSARESAAASTAGAAGRAKADEKRAGRGQSEGKGKPGN